MSNTSHRFQVGDIVNFWTSEIGGNPTDFVNGIVDKLNRDPFTEDPTYYVECDGELHDVYEFQMEPMAMDEVDELVKI